jgi:predicted house-cleaning NTP pyrophosphatase (Maf/HAM1 superfamily)
VTAPIRFPHAAAPAPGTATEVAPGVLWLRLPLPMRLDHVNCYALDDGDGWTIVDTGFDTPTGRGIWAEILAGPLAGRPVRRVLVTHHHPDHIGLAGWFQTQHGAELWTTRTAWLFARMLTLDVQDSIAPETIAFWRAGGMPEAMIAARAAERPFNFADRVAPMPLGFHRIAEGDVLHLAGRAWDVRLGAGHAPDHATLWSRDCNLVLGGDQILDDDGVIVSKADNLVDIAARLRGFRGQTHHLHSGAALARDGQVVWRHVDTAALTVRDFSEAWLATYLEAEGAALTGVVGGYRLEGPGAQLFSRIDGDYFTVLGLPLWAVLEALRHQGVIDR